MDEVYRPCPFCGAKQANPPADSAIMMAREDRPRGRWSVDCLACGTCGPLADDMLAAGEKWNTRKGVDHG